VLLEESQENLKNVFLKLEKNSSERDMYVSRRQLYQPTNTLNIGKYNFNKV